MTDQPFYAQAFPNSLSFTVAGLCLTVWGVRGVSPRMEWPTNHLDCKDICCTKYIYIYIYIYICTSFPQLTFSHCGRSLFHCLGGAGGVPPHGMSNHLTDWLTEQPSAKCVYIDLCKICKHAAYVYQQPGICKTVKCWQQNYLFWAKP